MAPRREFACAWRSVLARSRSHMVRCEWSVLALVRRRPRVFCDGGLQYSGFSISVGISLFSWTGWSGVHSWFAAAKVVVAAMAKQLGSARTMFNSWVSSLLSYGQEAALADFNVVLCWGWQLSHILGALIAHALGLGLRVGCIHR